MPLIYVARMKTPRRNVKNVKKRLANQIIFLTETPRYVNANAAKTNLVKEIKRGTVLHVNVSVRKQLAKAVKLSTKRLANANVRKQTAEKEKHWTRTHVSANVVYLLVLGV